MTPMPRDIKPMLCTLLKKPFNDRRYVYEIKWDGYRVIACRDEHMLLLSSRGGHDYTRKYPPIAGALKKLSHDVVLDGEAVVLNKEGKPDFDALQKFNGQKSGALYYVFDILWLDGSDLMGLTLLERKAILKEIVSGNRVIRYSDHFDDGIALYQHARAMGLEGIIAKEKTSRYLPEHRGKEWYKIPTELQQEFVIGGWVESENRLFRTLLFGAYDGQELTWMGHAGGGFKEREMPSILSKLTALETKNSPFVNHVDYEGIVHWVKPELVANVKFSTFTKGGKIRKPAIFLGFREDKDPKEVVKEEPVHAEPVPSRPAVPAGDGHAAMAGSNWPVVEGEEIRTEETLDVHPCPIKVYNVERVLWKGVTKAHLIQYYHSMASYLLPHLKDRPLSLYLKLRGPHAAGVYIKDMEGRQPECADIFSTRRKHRKEGKRDVIDYLVCNNVATLIYIINLGCIDVNPWTSRTISPVTPDYVVIDLDPSDGDFSKAIEAAQAARDYFGRHALKSFVKTSGKTGIHLYLPCSVFSFADARVLATRICEGIHELVPGITTTQVSVADRGTSLYLDPNQNDYADTVAAPYCVRPSRTPIVSTPLSWREVNGDLDPAAFTMDSIEKRLRKKGDLFKAVLDRNIAAANDKALKKLM